MATGVKTVANMAKHLTKGEIEAREAAEAAVLPARKIKKPKLIAADKAAAKHWTRILKDMEGLEILDVLDTDALAIYCAKLARRDDIQEKYLQVRELYREDSNTGTLRTMTDLSGELQSVEKDLLAYASKLGLTPESRARLARKIAEQEAADPDDDLFA